jgi:hypothetical protein
LKEKNIKSPIDPICYSVVFINYWAGLSSSTDQEPIRRGANVMINVAMESHAGTSSAPRIEGPRSSNDGQDGAAGGGLGDYQEK